MEVKMNRRKCAMLVVILLLPVLAFGQVQLKPYGFVKGEMVYATKVVYSWGNSNLSAPQFASDYENAVIGFTGQHTRFGLRGSAGEDVKAGGRIELDFYGGAFDTNIKPRMRLAYAWFSKENIEMRFGQQWDLFSPVNASTNNTNGNMWFAGNRGFRRGQIQFIYKAEGESVKPLLQLSLGEGTKETAGLGADNLSGMPMLQGRFSVTTDKNYTVGGSFVYAKHDPDPEVDDNEFNSMGFCADFNLPVNPKFALKGEVNMGTNLNNLNLFNIAGSGEKDYDRKALGIWFNVNSKLSDKVSSVIGFGMDKNQSENLVPEKDVESNMVIYGDLIFPVAQGMSVAIELMNISTSIKDGDTNSALVFNVAGKVNF